MNVRRAVLVPLIAVVLVGAPIAGFVLAEDAERVSSRSAAPVEDPQADAEPASEDDREGKAKGKAKGKTKAKAAEKGAEKGAAGAAHAAAMKAWTRCLAEAVATPGPGKPKPWQACPQKPLGPGRAAHEKEKPTPPGHAKQAGEAGTPAGR